MSCTEQEKDPKFWNAWAQRTLKKALTLQNLNQNTAKNLIFFLGDGEPQQLLTSRNMKFPQALCKSIKSEN